MSASEDAVLTQGMRSIVIDEKSTDRTEGNIHIKSFSVQDPDSATLGNKAIVGTVTFFNNSAMVWIGWGELDDNDKSQDKSEFKKDPSSGVESLKITNSGLPVMGPLVVAMPRSKYAGVGSHDEAPCSQLISGANDEEMMLGWQMASRLTKKVGWPIFVSTSLDKNNEVSLNKVEGIEGFDISSVLLSAALAEKKVGEIILRRKAEIQK